MKRLFWMLVGAGIAVAIALKGKELLHRLTPAGVAEQVERTGNRAAANLGDFYATFKTAMAEREEELRRELRTASNE
ncbi:MAG: hypothetical protein ACK5KO_14060 [Arachnia sp.]